MICSRLRVVRCLNPEFLSKWHSLMESSVNDEQPARPARASKASKQIYSRLSDVILLACTTS
eukprot:scaffold484828_cov17-Prasinocladus_malaysianus.AAC.2